MEECPICMDDVPAGDISSLAHAGGIGGVGSSDFATAVGADRPLARSKSGRDVSEHKACSKCREAMLNANQPCPWCRDEVVWNQVFGFLDNLKGEVGSAASPDQLADLMAQWEIYEMTRSISDVQLFARDMIMDRGLAKHLDKAIKGNSAWLRDSIGLWCRFHCMVVDDNLRLSDPAAGERLRLAVEAGLASFDTNGGNAPEHGGACYTQLCVALLCAQNKTGHTETLVKLAQRVGKTCVRFWHRKNKHNGVRSRLPRQYCEGVSQIVWGEKHLDPMLMTFYPELANATAAQRETMCSLIAEGVASAHGVGAAAKQGEDVQHAGGAHHRKKNCLIM